jgi:hypothetical protein
MIMRINGGKARLPDAFVFVNARLEKSDGGERLFNGGAVLQNEWLAFLRERAETCIATRRMARDKPENDPGTDDRRCEGAGADG